MSCADPQTVRLTITPGNNQNQDSQLQNCDTLVIHWAGPGKFCVTSVTPSSPYPFDQQLPHGGEHNGGHEWTGKAVVDNATVVYTTVSSSENCSDQRPTATGGSGTIKIGTGMGAKK